MRMPGGHPRGSTLNVRAVTIIRVGQEERCHCHFEQKPVPTPPCLLTECSLSCKLGNGVHPLRQAGWCGARGTGWGKPPDLLCLQGRGRERDSRILGPSRTSLPSLCVLSSSVMRGWDALPGGFLWGLEVTAGGSGSSRRDWLAALFCDYG